MFFFFFTFPVCWLLGYVLNFRLRVFENFYSIMANEWTACSYAEAEDCMAESACLDAYIDFRGHLRLVRNN